MKVEKRKQEILKIVEEKKKVAISTLSELLETPEVTVRRSVRDLEKENKIRREHGFAVYLPEVVLPKPLFDPQSLPPYISEIAALVIDKLIVEKATIWLGDGDISCEIARRAKNIALITNSLRIAVNAATQPNNGVKITLLGEYLENKKLILKGPSLFAGLDEQNIQLAFIEAEGFDTQDITARADKVDIFKKIMEVKKRKSVALIQPNLFGKNSEKIVDHIKNFDWVISDYGIYNYMPSREEQQEFKSLFHNKKSLILTSPKVVSISDYNCAD